MEGSVQEGKSTLIRKAIKNHIKDMGGFSSQRLINSCGETKGFRIVPASEAMELTRSYSPDLPDIFLFADGRYRRFRPEIFRDKALNYLKNNESKRMILLDEIGGIELLVPEFRQALYETLEGNIPCIGVIKTEAANRNLGKYARAGEEGMSFYYSQLKDVLIDRCHSKIAPFERNNPAGAEGEIQAFINNIFI